MDALGPVPGKNANASGEGIKEVESSFVHGRGPFDVSWILLARLGIDGVRMDILSRLEICLDEEDFGRYITGVKCYVPGAGCDR